MFISNIYIKSNIRCAYIDSGVILQIISEHNCLDNDSNSHNTTNRPFLKSKSCSSSLDVKIDVDHPWNPLFYSCHCQLKTNVDIRATLFKHWRLHIRKANIVVLNHARNHVYVNSMLIEFPYWSSRMFPSRC